jgi:hypothetical protein
VIAMRRIGAAGLGRGGENGVAATRDGRVDEREAVVLAHEIRVDETQPRELDQVPGDLTHTHGSRNLHPSPAIGGSNQMMLAFVASSVLLT